MIGNIRCPYLIVNGKQDAQRAYTNTEEIAREAENAGVKVTYGLYEEGTHGQLSVDRIIGEEEIRDNDWQAQEVAL